MIASSLVYLRIKMDALCILCLTFCFVISVLLLHSPVGRYKKRSREDAVDNRGPDRLRSPQLGPRANQGRNPQKFEPNELIRQRPSKRIRADEWVSLPESTAEKAIPVIAVVPLDELQELEKKWHAVLEFRVLKATGTSTNAAVDSIGEKYGVGTGRNVRLLSEYVDNRGSLMRKEGSGSPRTVTNRIDVQEYFNELAEDWEYNFTYEAMALALQDKFGVGSTASVKSIMDLLEYRKHRQSVKPFLTPEHMSSRFHWAVEWVNFDFFDEDTVVVHIDEKCFYAFDRRGKVVYLPPDVEATPFYALSKTQIPYVMFLGAVAAPRPDKNFDGLIGLWHVGEAKIAERKSKYHERGEEYYVNVNMDGDFFMDLMKTAVIPAVEKKCGWAKRIILQYDSAGGHRVGESLDYLNNIGKKKSPIMEFITQPTRSPDTNVLDLGIWRSMSSRVTTVKYQRNSELSMTQRIIDAVMEMYHEYDPIILHNIFVTLKMVLYEIQANNGGNSFKLPHSVKED